MFWKRDNKKTKVEEKGVEKPEIKNLVRRTYGVELYFDTEITEIPVEQLLQKLKLQFGNVEIVGDQENSKLIMFNDNQVEYTDAKVPTQIALLKSSKVSDVENFEAVFGQSWDFPNAKEEILKCKSSILVTDMMSSCLDYKDRMRQFLTTLKALIEIVDCKAVFWQPSQQFIRPETIRDNVLESEQYNPIQGIANVRLFNISGSNNELLMDTVGLSELGLFDFEMTFSELNEQQVASLLYTYASYIFENGNVIQDGHTIQGIEQDSKLLCSVGESLTEPKRYVIKLVQN
jgi:hypothetical protein